MKKKLIKLNCLQPFIFLSLHKDGEVYFCCPSRIKIEPIGNLFDKGIEEIWNNNKMKEIRRRFYDNKIGTICSSKYCSLVDSIDSIELDQLERDNEEFKKIISAIRARKVELPFLPLVLTVAVSGECSLRCKMCMSNIDFIPDNKCLNRKVFDKVIPKLLPGLRHLNLTGNGDPFCQKEVIDFLKNFKKDKYSKLKIDLLTNGMFFNLEMWKKIKHCNYGTISVSIDASSRIIYEKIRRGGNWDKLQENLKLISKLRQQGRFEKFVLNFVVMKSNFREMKDFVYFGMSLKADKINFQKIFGYSPGCWEENINLFRSPKIYLKIKKILKNPVFKKKIVDISQIEDYKIYKMNFWDKLGFYKFKKALFLPSLKLYYLIPVKLRRKILIILKRIFPRDFKFKMMN